MFMKLDNEDDPISLQELMNECFDNSKFPKNRTLVDSLSTFII